MLSLVAVLLAEPGAHPEHHGGLAPRSGALGPVPGQTAEEAEECRGWLNGTRGTYLDPSVDARRKFHHAMPGGFTSQYRQDRELWRNRFRHRDRPGVYVDVAANDYKRISNTYFLDRCAGWRGVCVEPNPIYHDDLAARRSCELIKTCASSSTREVELRMSTDPWQGTLGGVIGSKKPGLEAHAGPTAGVGAGAGADVDASLVTAKMRCVRLGHELMRLGLTHVDLMSLDVEGHEADVLKGIDFTKVTIDLILCEGNSACAEILPANGYNRTQIGRFDLHDAVWVRRGSEGVYT